MFYIGGFMSIYQENGYIDIRKIMSYGMPFNFIVGGRATGKTYTSLKTMVDDDTMFMFMRRTQTQADIINKPEFSPFKPINRDNGWNIGTKVISPYNSAFYEMSDEDGKNVPVGLPKGYTCALSTISNMRGFDASDVKVLIYDEFIPEKHERPLKNEGMALFNAYETINRNRELNGEKPLQLLGLANANDLANPVFMSLNIVRKAHEMKKRGQEVSIMADRGIGLFILSDSPISNAKRDTALYRLTKNTEFSAMSLDNDFIQENSAVIKSRNIAEYTPTVAVGEICIYTHKSKSTYYVSQHVSGSPPSFGAGDIELNRFRRAFPWVWWEYLSKNVEFEDVLCEVLLNRYCK